MLDWLVGSSDFLGVTWQNWMLLIGGGLLVYFAILAIAQRHQPR